MSDSYYYYKCHACKETSKVFWKGAKGVAHNQKCHKCGAVGKYWNEQLDVENYRPPKTPDFCLAVICFNPDLLINMVNNLQKFTTGTPADVYFVHNSFEADHAANRGEARSREQVNRIREIIEHAPFKNKVLIERENVGEDVGGQQFIFELLKHKYKYFFFINEAAPPLCDDWLKGFWKMFEDNENVVAVSPKVVKKPKPWGSEKFKYILPTTYWGLRSSFGIEHLVWPPPKNRAESKAQEMQLIYPQAHEKGYCLGQVGTGANLMHLGNMAANATYEGDGGIVC